MKRIVVLLFVALLACAAIGLIGANHLGIRAVSGQEGVPTVTTDKRDYTPGETVRIDGTDFEAFCDLTVRITRPNTSVDPAAVACDQWGSFVYYYALNGIEGEYLVQVVDGADNVLATTTFWDGHTDFTQCENDSDDNNVRDDCGWVTGALNQSNSFYTEGDSVPQRVLREIDTAGSTTLVVEYMFTKASIYAYDFLTDVAETQSGALLAPCQNAPGWADDAGECDGSNTLYNNAVSVSIPSDPFGPATVPGHPAEKVSDAERADFPPREFKVSCAPNACTGISLHSITHDPAATCYKDCGDSTVTISLTLTTPQNNTLVGVWFGGHLAQAADPDPANSPPDGWGTGCASKNCGASSITGAPFHIKYEGRSNQVSKAGIQALGNVQICKNAVPDDPQDFSFAGSGAIGTFLLDDDADATLPNCRTFSNIPPDQYTVTETVPAGWSLTSIACVDPDSGSTVSPPTANIDLDPAETVTCTFTDTKEPDTADVKKESLQVLTPPTEIDVSEDVPITVRGVLHNLGPVTSVDVSDTLTAVAPSGCSVSPPVSVAARTLAVSVDVTVDTPLTIHCSEPSQHTFDFGNSVAITTPGITDPDPTNNTGSTQLTVDVIAYADVQIVDQYFDNPPAEIDVSADVPVTLVKVLHNNGGFPLTVPITKTAAAPADCSIDPPLQSHQVPLPPSVDVVLSEQFTIHCSQPSEHTFTVGNVVGQPKEAHIVDPDETNNVDSTDLTVDAIAYADLWVESVEVPVSLETDVSANFNIPLSAVIHNLGPYGPVWAHGELTFGFNSQLCEVFVEYDGQKIPVTPDVPVPGPSVELPVSVNVTAPVALTGHCSQQGYFLSSGSINLLVDSPPHVEDPDPSNNGFPHVEGPPVTVIDYADVEDIAAFPDWASLSPPRLGIDNDGDTKVDEDWYDGLDNDGDQLVDEDLPDFNVSQDYSVNLVDLIQNNGPLTPVGVTLQIWGIVPGGVEFSYHCDGGERVEVDSTVIDPCPAGTTVWANPGQTFRVTLAVPPIPGGFPVPVVRKFDWHCLEPSQHVWNLNKEIWPSNEYTHDPNSSNNDGVVPVGINCIAKADVKIVSQGFVDPPAEINVSQNVPVTLRKVLHNNGPYPGSVTVTFTKTAAAPDDCSISPLSHSQDVVLPQSVDVTVDEAFTIHCEKPSSHTFTVDNVVSGPKEPHIIDPDLTNNDASAELTVNALADVDVAVSQQVLDWPADIDVSDNVVVTLRKTITATVLNQQPYNIPSVAVTVTKTASAPAGCTVTPTSVVEPKVVLTTAPLVFEETFIIHCTEPSNHGPFVFDNVVSGPKDAHVSDPNADNNRAETTDLSVNALADVDVAVSQQVLNWPTDIDVSDNVVVTLEKTITATVQPPATTAEVPQVEVTVTKTASAPAGCSITPTSGAVQKVVSTTTPLVFQETFTIHCSEPSNHGPFVFRNVVGDPKDAHVSDPDTGNNTAETTDLSVNALADVDVAVSQQVLNWPTDINVSQNKPITVRKTITATVRPPATTAEVPQVEVTVTKTASAPAGCTVAPTSGAVQKVVPTTGSLVFDETFTIHCSEPSNHGPFVFRNVVGDPKDPHISDPDTGNNTAETTDLSVNALADVDVAVTQTIVSPPTEIDVSQNKPITVRKTITATVLNQQPYNIPSVTVTVTKTASAPADCTVTPTSGAVQKVVPTTGSLVFDETFTIHCTKPSTHGPFVFNNQVSQPKDAHISDPNTGNNTAQTELSVDAIAYSDLKVADQYFENPPAEILVSQDVTVTLDKILHNNGPWGPVDAQTVTVVTAPSDCTVSPAVHTQSFWDLPVGVDILHHEPFTIHCSQPSVHTFVFDDEVHLTSGPHVRDLVSGNDAMTTELTVDVVGHADIKIVSAGFVDPPDKLPYDTNVDITLRKVVHNNGPWGEAVNVAIDAAAVAPTGCTIVAKSVPTSLTDVPVSVDRVVDEVWTIHCTETGLKTFVFDNSLEITTVHVSDPNLSNNSSHKVLSLMDDASAELDYDSDGSCDACELAAGTSITNPDTDADGVSDGLLDPDGEGPIVAGADNCPLVANASQADYDGDGIGDACETDDSDADGFVDALEVYLPTDPLASCAGQPPHDAWPLDVNMDGMVTVAGDVLPYAGRIGESAGPPLSINWRQRLDLNADGRITVAGDVLKFAGNIGRRCG